MALVLSRKDGEGVSVDGPAIVRVKRCAKSRRLKLIVEADRSVRVKRVDIPR